MASAGDLFSRYAAFLVDVDGVLTRGGEALPGAAAAIASLRRFGRLLLLTNNSTRSRADLAAHLASLGFDVRADEVLGSAFLASRYLSLHFGACTVWVLGEDGVRCELAAAGHRVAEDPTEAAWVVVGMDRCLTYEKLTLALHAVLNGARVLATNEDSTFPTATGLVPGAGALVGALRGMGFPPECVVGKPSAAAFEVALDVLELPPHRVLMIGDRLDTDIAGARAAGLDSALVLTGVSSREDAERCGVRPTWVAENLSALCAGRVA